MKIYIAILLSLFFLGVRSQTFAKENKIKTCDDLTEVEVPIGDQKSSVKLDATKCDSASLYYGLEQSVDYVKARLCAFAEREAAADAELGGGAGVLTMVYANGFGVKQNLNLAEKFSCEMDNGFDESAESRLAHLEKMRTSKKKSHFDVCDDGYSHFQSLVCTSLSNRIQTAKREKKLKTLMVGWSAEQVAEFKKLRTRAYNYIQKHSSDEMDKQGTSAQEYMLSEEGRLEKEFFETLSKFEKKQIPQLTANEFEKLDRSLNEIYKKILLIPGDFVDETSQISKNDIQATERLWVNYKKAWLDFAKIRNKDYSIESVSGYLTKNRIEQLKEFIPSEVLNSHHKNKLKK